MIFPTPTLGGAVEAASPFSGLTPRHLFVSYSHADAAFAVSLISLLHKGGVDVWFDEERIRGGIGVQRSLHAAIRGSAAGLFLVSEAWLQSENCQWEAAAFYEDHKKARLMIPLLRMKRRVADLPPYFTQLAALEWFERRPTEALFWLLHCALTGEDPGPQATWEGEGRNRLRPEGAASVGRPVRIKADPVEEAAHRTRLGYARAALRCNRDPQWSGVDSHALVPLHEALFIQGARIEAPELFLQAVEQGFPESPPRLIVPVAWNIESLPNTRGEFREALATALQWPEPTLEHALRDWLWEANLVLVHRPILRGSLEAEAMEEYYTELLPSLLPWTPEPRGFLKVVQGVDWAANNPALTFLARVARRLGVESPWTKEAMEEERIEQLLQGIEGKADPRLRVFLLPPLIPITGEDVERWSKLLEPGRDRAAVVREILRGAKTSAEILTRASRQLGPRERRPPDE